MAMTLSENVPLDSFTTLGTGGAARFFCECRSEADVREALELADDRKLPVQVLGGGSNTVFADDGYPGLVLHVAVQGMDCRRESGRVELSAGAGVDWDDLVAAAVSRGLRGLECLSGIPGTVGAAPIQNIGAYGQEAADCLMSVRCIDRETLEIRHFRGDACQFGYRTSRFKTSDRDRFVITSVSFALEEGVPARPAYPDLARELAETGASVARLSPPEYLAAVRHAVLNIRRRKAMLIDPADPNTRSAGSFFLNPVLHAGAYDAFARRAAELGEGAPPVYPADDGVKVPAAWLVEHAGFRKGYRRGGVGISERHALALINRGGGSARLLELADMIEERVFQRFGVRLQKELVIVPG